MARGLLSIEPSLRWILPVFLLGFLSLWTLVHSPRSQVLGPDKLEEVSHARWPGIQMYKDSSDECL
eukprot:6430391-Amphidinium_carterae.1